MAAAASDELGCGSASTAWRRLNEWAEAGVFDQLHLIGPITIAPAARPGSPVFEPERVQVPSWEGTPTTR